MDGVEEEMRELVKAGKKGLVYDHVSGENHDSDVIEPYCPICNSDLDMPEVPEHWEEKLDNLEKSGEGQ